jgi:hypothetical protein
MAFALWIEGDLAWAQGRHEYRPMGTAVIGVEGYFRGRDFCPRRKPPKEEHASYVGLFASLSMVNVHLRLRRRSRTRSRAGAAQP